MPQHNDPQVTRALTENVQLGDRRLGGSGPVEIIGFSAAEVVGGGRARILKRWMLADGFTERKARRKAHGYVSQKRQKKRRRRFIVIRHTQGGGEDQEPEEPGNGGEE